MNVDMMWMPEYDCAGKWYIGAGEEDDIRDPLEDWRGYPVPIFMNPYNNIRVVKDMPNNMVRFKDLRPPLKNDDVPFNKVGLSQSRLLRRYNF